MCKSIQFVGIIPARYASTRFPGKPLAMIGDKPMIQRVYERAKEVFDAVYVATDDVRIQSAVEAFGGKVVMTSTNHKSGTDRCAEAITIIQNESGIQADVVVNIQGDEPFIAPAQLKQLCACFESDGVQIATLVKPFGMQEDIFSANSPKVAVSAKGYALYFSRSVVPFLRGVNVEEWKTTFPYLKHIGLYAYRTTVLAEIAQLQQTPLELAESLEQLRWLESGYAIKVARSEYETHAIDTPEDLERILSMGLL